MDSDQKERLDLLVEWEYHNWSSEGGKAETIPLILEYMVENDSVDHESVEFIKKIK